MTHTVTADAPRIDGFFVVHAGGTRTIDGISPLLASLGDVIEGMATTSASGDESTLRSMLLATAPKGLTNVAFVAPVRDALARATAGLDDALVVEPSMRVEGMVAASPGSVRSLRQQCDERGVALIADERVTGMGRTGFLWSITREGVAPDMLVVGSMLTGGDGSLGAVLYRDGLQIRSDDVSADDAGAAIATLKALGENNFLGEARRKASVLSDLLTDLAGHPKVADVRARGLMAGIELHEDAEPAMRRAHDLGASVGATGKALALAPPLAIPDNLLIRLIDTVRKAL